MISTEEQSGRCDTLRVEQDKKLLIESPDLLAQDQRLVGSKPCRQQGYSARRGRAPAFFVVFRDSQVSP